MASALHDRTNSDSPTLQPSKTICRPQSSRLLDLNLDSDDTFSSEHSSIYDAPLVLSDRNGGHEGEPNSALNMQKSSSLPLSPSFENLDQLADLASVHTIQLQETTLPTSHSNWPIVQLETITEQRSISTLHTSVSLPRLNTQTTQHSAANAELEPSTIRQPPHWPLNLLAVTKSFNRRSFSENDTACLRLPVWKGTSSIYKEYLSDSSSSSEELLRRRCIAIWPPYPLKPRYPPPERTPTPPGLPTFGTREAIELLHVPGTRGSSARNSHGRPPTRTGRPATAAERDRLPPITPVLQPLDQSSPPKGKSITQRIIRSLCRSSLEEPRDAEARRVSLPAGFVARAENGTLVRGRFGVRNSGHGVGARTGHHAVGLEGHPFHRLEPAVRTLEEETGEIDKACEAAARSGPQGADGSGQAGVLLGAQSSRLQRPAAIHEYGGASTTCTRFWSARINHVAPPARGSAIPIDSRVRVVNQPELVRGERTMLQRRMSAQSVILEARLEEAEERRKQRLDSCETQWWSWMRGWCCEEDRMGKQEARALFAEDRRIALRRSPHMLESEEPILPNARIVYPTRVSEEVTI